MLTSVRVLAFGADGAVGAGGGAGAGTGTGTATGTNRAIGAEGEYAHRGQHFCKLRRRQPQAGVPQDVAALG